LPILGRIDDILPELPVCAAIAVLFFIISCSYLKQVNHPPLEIN
jgi:hypothetical protein